MSLYNINSNDFYELIDRTKVKLKNNNFRYKKLIEKSLKILKDYPNLQLLFEGETLTNLNKIECKMLQKLFVLHLKINEFENQEIFFLGGKEFYLYLKNMHVI